MVKKIGKLSRKVPFGFGTACPRFCGIGLHPKLDLSGSSKKVTSKGGPGQYDVSFLRCTHMGADESVWTRMVELEEFSKFLGFRNAPILAARAFQKIHRGPGTYNIPDDVDRQKSCSVVENKGFTTAERFRFKNENPPMDAYFRNIFAERHAHKKTFGLVPCFEWDGKQARFKNKEPSFRKPPNLYKVPDPNSLEALLKRVVSTKRPFNLFTGKRDASSIKNHFSPPGTVAPDKFHLEPSEMDKMLHHPMKRRYGKFLREERFPKRPTTRMLLADLTMCYRNPEEPGPAHYDLSQDNSFKPVTPAVYPFGSSNIHSRPPTAWPIHPGPGRYYMKMVKCKTKSRPSWVFLTKPGRDFFPPVEKYSDF